VQRKLNQKQQTMDWLSQRLQQQNPSQKLTRNLRRMNELEARFKLAMQTRLRYLTGMIEEKTAKLWQSNPAISINSHKQRHNYLKQCLLAATHHQLEQNKQRLLNTSQTLHAVSPLATLNRGYAMAIVPSSGEIIRSTEQLKPGDVIQTRLAQGQFTSQIKTIQN
jgi:exodeoxyribonuclease VII large subunit